MGVSSDLQRAIVARLKSAVPSVSGRVYDRKVAESATMPYCRVGPVYGQPDDADCIEGQRLTVQIDVFASSYPDSRAVNDATDEVRAALHGWVDTTALTMHPMRVTLWRIMDDPDPSALHGVVQVEVALET